MFSNQIFLLHGMGISLHSLANYFVKNNVQFYISDKNRAVLEDFNYPKFPEWHNNDELLKYSKQFQINNIVIAPGINNTAELIEATYGASIKIWNDITLFLHISKVKHILCTGTFGKSTCVSLLKSLYESISGNEVQLGGNIGIPVFDLDPNKLAILELSAQQLELFSDSVNPLLSILLNIYYPHHTDRYKTREAYENAKLLILRNAQKILVNSSLINLIPTVPHKSTMSIEDDSAYFYAKDGYVYEDKKLVGYTSCNAAPISFIGAYAAIRILFPNIDPVELLKYISGFKGLDYRCQVIWYDAKTNAYIINDSKSTSLMNTAHCIRQFARHGKIGWIGGGKNQEQDLREMDEVLKYIECAALTGSSANKLGNYLELKSVKHKVFQELADCIKWIRSNNCNVIIFSPGYASTDQYKNFEERGMVFNRTIKSELGSI